jgi:hypothetical protein
MFESGVSATLISVSAGEVLEIYSYAGHYPLVVKDGVSTGFPTGNTSAFPARIVGPAEIKTPTTSGSVMLTYKKTPNTSSSSTTTPANAVVIPTDATGSVQIILESSTDLVTWTQANPGTYGASTTKRFFRIRAVNQ